MGGKKNKNKNKPQQAAEQAPAQQKDDAKKEPSPKATLDEETMNKKVEKIAEGQAKLEQ